jgi:DNA-binding MarR family transcriptional regulator
VLKVVNAKRFREFVCQKEFLLILSKFLTKNKIRNILLINVIYYVLNELLLKRDKRIMDISEKRKLIFGSIFLLANRLQVMGDQYLEKEGMTTKQWFMTAMISQFGKNPPTLSEVAELMGSSRQNVKQLALKLEEKEFLKIEKDLHDARALRLKLTDKSQAFWDKRQEQDEQFIKDIFEGLGEEEIDMMLKSFKKLTGILKIKLGAI